MNKDLMVFIKKNHFNNSKNEAYVINLGEYKSVDTDWIALYMHDNNVTCFVDFGVSKFQKKL